MVCHEDARPLICQIMHMHELDIVRKRYIFYKSNQNEMDS